MGYPWRKGGRKEAAMKIALRLSNLRSLVVAVVGLAGLCVPVLQYPLSCMLSLISALQDGRPSPLCRTMQYPAPIEALVTS